MSASAITWRCWSGTAPRPSAPTWPSPPSATCFAGTTSRLSGVGFDQLAEETRRRTGYALHAGAGMEFRRLDTGGEYQWRRDGEPHLFSPEAVFKLQHATRSRRYEIFKEYTTLVDDQSRRLMTLRGLLRIRGVDH